jgi:hypothetical protein
MSNAAPLDLVEKLGLDRRQRVPRGREDDGESSGRYLLVVLCEAWDGGTGIVTARDMDDAEERGFRKKRR